METLVESVTATANGDGLIVFPELNKADRKES